MSIKIGLDCGHGLNTAGKQTPDGIKEWILNDAVRDKIAVILADYDVELIYVDGGEGVTDEPLAHRLKTYIDAGVSAFVSLHHNAFTGQWNDATGVEIYVDRNYTARDYQLAQAIYKRLPQYTGLKGRGIKEANFHIINQNRIPAVLVEGGFMDGKNDYNVITSEVGQDAYARAVAEGLIEFLNINKKATPIINTPVAPQNKVNPNILEWQKAAIADGFTFPKYGADGKWGAECEAVAKKAIVKKRKIYQYCNLTKIVQSVVGTTIDGKCGANTDKAIRDWQSKNGLTVDGCVGINSWKKILGI